ncbi:MAG: hypothetical protein JWM81_741 [Candidatus Saccharibacteria bacterium]|nr:hypothetical protein [Candidatus Saccharibacteria bacterium]
MHKSQRVLIEDRHEQDFIVAAAREQGYGLFAGRVSLAGYLPKAFSMSDTHLQVLAATIEDQDRALAALQPPQALPEHLGDMHATISAHLAQKACAAAGISGRRAQAQ